MRRVAYVSAEWSKGAARVKAFWQVPMMPVVSSAARPAWLRDRLEHELEAFIASRDTDDLSKPPKWPAYREFRRAGRKRLADQLAQHGGSAY